MIKTTVVGSYPMFSWLAAYPGEQAVQDATAVVLKTQELAGLDLVADGELYRFDVDHPETNGMIDYFIRRLGGVRSSIGRQDVADFLQLRGMGFRRKPAGVIEGPLTEGTLDLVSDYERVRALTKAPLKFTLTGPHMLSKTLYDTHYTELPLRAFKLAEVLAEQIRSIRADVVQLDEANLPGSPHEAGWAAEAINIMLDAVPHTAAVHLCFGNYGGQTIQEGSWESLIAYMNALHVDHLVLEFARRGYAEMAHFNELREDIGLGVGVIDVKTTVIESPEQVARRIDQAAVHIGVDRIRYVHPDCGFWMLPRSVADGKIRALVAGRDLFEGR